MLSSSSARLKPRPQTKLVPTTPNPAPPLNDSTTASSKVKLLVPDTSTSISPASNHSIPTVSTRGRKKGSKSKANKDLSGAIAAAAIAALGTTSNSGEGTATGGPGRGKKKCVYFSSIIQHCFFFESIQFGLLQINEEF